MVTLVLAWCVLCALTAHKSAHGHGHGHSGKVENDEFWRELSYKGGCCCFGWAIYALWACYMDIRALYNPKPPKWPLIGLPGLAGDPVPCHLRPLSGLPLPPSFFFKYKQNRNKLKWTMKMILSISRCGCVLT
jgi:hypothetical protein